MAAMPLLQESSIRGFTGLFGVRPEVCALAWNLLDVGEIDGVHFRHMLWALMFMKSYARESVLTSIAKVCRTTFRTWAKKVMIQISGLRTHVVRAFAFDVCIVRLLKPHSKPSFSLQIKLSNRFRGDKGCTCKMTIDGTDCLIYEPSPFDQSWFTHKKKTAGLQHEVGVCIQTGDICWINGPFRCRRWSDLGIFHHDLKQQLTPGEMVECDGGCTGDPSCRHKHWFVNEADSRAKSEARARHETVNGDLHAWACLSSVWRHGRGLHKCAFAAAAVMTQLSYNLGGGPKFQVQH